MLLRGYPLVNVGGVADVDPAGTVVWATAPLLLLRALGEVPLAPAGEVLRRLVHGPGLINGCYDECQISTAGATLGLALVTNGRLGSYDHIPGGIVADPRRHFLVPALRVPWPHLTAAATSPECSRSPRHSSTNPPTLTLRGWPTRPRPTTTRLARLAPASATLTSASARRTRLRRPARRCC